MSYKEHNEQKKNEQNELVNLFRYWLLMIIIKTTIATNFVLLNTGKIKILHDSKMADSRKDSVGN